MFVCQVKKSTFTDCSLSLLYRHFSVFIYLFLKLQIAHLATTYAAVNTLVTIGGEKALASIDRCKFLPLKRQHQHQT